MSTYNTEDRVIFSTPKGTIKIGIVKEVKSILNQDEYEDIYTIELENGKVHYVDTNHILSTAKNDNIL
jgi:hypothetical protein